MLSVYLVRNKVNGKVYIGKTSISPEKRFGQHCRDAKVERKNSYFHKAIVKYGSENFEISVLDICDTNEKANLSEMYYIVKYNSKNNKIGYNLTDGGDGTVGRKRSRSEIEAHRQKMIGRKLSEEHKRKISEGNKGKTITEAQKLAISKRNIGHGNGMYGNPGSMESRIIRGKNISKTKVSKPLVYREIKNETLEKLRIARENREPISDDIKDEIVTSYKTEIFTKRYLSGKYNIPLNRIQNILRYWERVRANMILPKVREPHVNKEQRNHIIKLISEGLCYSDVSNMVGVPVDKVKNVCRYQRRKSKTSDIVV